MSRLVVLPGLAVLALLAGCSPTVAMPTPTPSETFAVTGDGTLIIGTLFDVRTPTGAAEVAGVEIAVREINAAGGVLGVPVQAFHRDAGDAASEAALVDKGADVILGGAASTVPDLTSVVVDPGTELPDAAFTARLRQADPGLTDLAGAIAAYEATIQVALAVVLSADDGSAAITRTLPAVVADGIPCASFGECLDTLTTQTNIAYAQQFSAVAPSSSATPAA